MNKVLGLDLGTNSIGWAIVTEHTDGYTLNDYGVNIFQEGVKIEKGIESSKAAERTKYRLSRRRYMRRKHRKIETLKVLSEAGMCPYLAQERLKDWKQKGKYPLDEQFILWLKSEGENNPYHYRYQALTRKLDLNLMHDRYILGRAMYHISQRRGFLSNRLEKTKESEGKVKESIQQLSVDMGEMGCEFLGEYFYKCYAMDKKIRNRYTSRKEHYQKEFNEICRVQQLNDEIKIALEKAIFFQRPLKSQKGVVGKCTFEKNKNKCSVSHPKFEEYRMLCFINNIKIQTPGDSDLRPLSSNEKEQITPLFYRKSKRQFEFEDIAKKIAGKNNYAFFKEPSGKPFLFNFRMDTTVSGSPVTAHLIDIFGLQWEEALVKRYKTEKSKTPLQVVNDIWHVLFSFNDDDKLKQFAIKKLQCDENEANEFCKIPVPQEYAALSLSALEKILPYLRSGLLYSHSVFLANLSKAIPKGVWENTENRKSIIKAVSDIIVNNPKDENTLASCISDFIEDNFNIPSYEVKKRLYHPSMIEAYPDAKPDISGKIKLDSPRISSVRNPMAMRSLFRLRKLINSLLEQGKITRETKIRIEFARGLNDANRRKAIKSYQQDRENIRKKYLEEIKTLYYQECKAEIVPTEAEILKFQLWIEQKETCPYTGRKISICQFIGPNPEFDIEHTIPRSVGGDDSQMNKTLCENRFNREQKGTKLPSQLSNIDEVLVRISHWKEKCEDLRKQIERTRGSFSTKEIKDGMIQKRHKLQLELDYWSGKYYRFIMTKVPEGFSNRQGVDIGIISKYARLYLRSVFPKTYVVKGLTTAEFRRMWGLQEQYEKKERINHSHHLVDAVTIACIGPGEYSRMAEYFHNAEQFRWRRDREKPQFPKPWPTFTEDVLALENKVLISHHSPDNLLKQTKKKVRIRGRIKNDTDKKPIYNLGDSARGSLHQETFYGSIMHSGELKYVVRKELDKLKESDIENIVDAEVQKKISNAIAEKGFKQALADTIWMNEEKGVKIKKVRCFTPKVTSPIKLKEHRDKSRHEHKQQVFVMNDGNYIMAIFEGEDKKGKTNREFKLINNLSAVKSLKDGSNKNILQQESESGFPLKWIFKMGKMVLFYEKTRDEIYNADNKEIRDRLYKVIGMNKQVVEGKYHYGILTFKHHQEARQNKDLKEKSGEYISGQDYRPIICMTHKQVNALVEDYDFTLSVTGDVEFIKK